MIRNVYECIINAPIESLGTLFDRLGQKDDRLWPLQSWTPTALDRSPTVRTDGGRDVIRYYVGEYGPGQRVRFIFHPRTRIIGAHELSLDVLDDKHTRIHHILIGRACGAIRLMFPAMAGPLHDVVVGDPLDGAERETTGSMAQPASQDPRVRALRHLTGDK